MGNQCTKVRDEPQSRRSITQTTEDFDSIGQSCDETAGTFNDPTRTCTTSRCVEPSILSDELQTPNTSTKHISGNGGLRQMQKRVPNLLTTVNMKQRRKSSMEEPAQKYRDFDGEDMENSNSQLTPVDDEEVLKSPNNIITQGRKDDLPLEPLSFSAVDDTCDPNHQNDQSFGQSRMMHSWLDDQVNVRLKKSAVNNNNVDEARSASKKNMKVIACSEKVASPATPTPPSTTTTKVVQQQTAARVVVQQQPAAVTGPADNSTSMFGLVKRASMRRL